MTTIPSNHPRDRARDKSRYVECRHRKIVVVIEVAAGIPDAMNEAVRIFRDSFNIPVTDALLADG